MSRISVREIFINSKKALILHGAADWIADHVADAIAKSESVGNRICGLYYLESYCRQLVTGRVKGTVEPIVSKTKAAAVYVDAKMGFAQPAFAKGLPKAVDAVEKFGVATMSVGHAHTCTSLGYFTEQIANKGFLGLGLANASPIVAPPGGKTRVIGTNPIAFSVPNGEGGMAMQFDQSTTTVALGKITMAKAAGEKIPEGWALDKDGQPTTDPDVALKGSLVSLGGYKGWGFGLMAELLAAGMTGSLVSRNVNPLKSPDGPPHDLGQFYIIINPDCGSPFYDRLHQVMESVSLDEKVRLPGQCKTRADSVEVPCELWQLTCDLAGNIQKNSN